MAIVVVGGCLLADVASVAHGEETKLNVLFLVSDDLRPDLGCYGNSVVKSPHIDRLASRGMVFERAYCQQAVCSPSRTSVLTGARPDTTKVWDLRTHFRETIPDVVTLPQHFKNHGYVSVGLGKIYHGDATTHEGLDDGLSWSEETGIKLPPKANRKRSAARSPEDNQAVTHPTPEDETLELTATDRGKAWRISDEPPNGGGEGHLADEAIAALQQLKSNSQPFFLAVGFHKPHLPFNAPRAYWEMYDPAAIPLAANPFLPQGAPEFALPDKNEMWKYSGVPDYSVVPEFYAKQLKHGYYACVSYMDAQVGRILDELERLELSDDTIVVLWGDHGWKLGEHARWCKHSNVEDDARAPLIFAVPGMESAGKHSDSLVEFVDIYPTLVELAGLPLPDHLEGKSLQPVLKDPQTELKSAAFSQYPRTVSGKRLMGYSMRTDRYRFTRWVDRYEPTKVEAVELYDHATDPQENVNIAGDEANQELVERLTKKWLAGWEAASSN